MSAYMVDLQKRCMSPGCDRRATKEVFDKRNASAGFYCVTHARHRLKALDVRSRYDEPVIGVLR